MLAKTPSPPYYAVIFSSIRTEGDNGYAEMADKMLKLAQQQEGYLGFESARNDIGIAVSYWNSLDAINKWKENAEHMIAREKGREQWYKSFITRISRVESDYSFNK